MIKRFCIFICKEQTALSADCCIIHEYLKAIFYPDLDTAPDTGNNTENSTKQMLYKLFNYYYKRTANKYICLFFIQLFFILRIIHNSLIYRQSLKYVIAIFHCHMQTFTCIDKVSKYIVVSLTASDRQKYLFSIIAINHYPTSHE